MLCGWEGNRRLGSCSSGYVICSLLWVRDIKAICNFIFQKSVLRSYPVCLGEDMMHLTQPREGRPLIVISLHPQQQEFVSYFCVFYTQLLTSLDQHHQSMAGRPRVGPGQSLPHLLLCLLVSFTFSFFPFLHASSIVLLFHSFSFYQNTPTPVSRLDVVGGD